MKRIQKIAAMLYALWAIFEGYVLLNSVVYDTATVGLNGVNYFDKMSFSTVLTLLLSLSLFTLSIFVVTISFLKNNSKKINVIAIVWLAINTILVFLIPELSYIVDKMAAIAMLFKVNADQTIFTVLSYTLSKNALIVIALLNMVVFSLNLRGSSREKT